MSFLPPQIASKLIDRAASEETVIVGGQAVSIWARRYGLIDQDASLTTDIGLYGGLSDVETADARFADMEHQTKLATMDDVGPNSGLILVRIDGMENPVIIDFLWSINGLSNVDLMERAPKLQVAGIERPISVLHPFQCVESKIANLGSLPGKRTPEGAEQARLSIESARAYQENDMGPFAGRRKEFLRVAERFARLSKTDAACFAHAVFGLDVLKAIPLAKIEDDAFRNSRWPQMVAEADERRQKFGARLPSTELKATQHLRFR